MKTLKVSPSILNEFAQFKRGDYERWGKGQEDFRQYVLGEYSPNTATSRGTAVHSILEGMSATPYKDTYQIRENEYGATWQFSADCYCYLQDYGRQYTGDREVADTMRIETARATVYMNMRFDCLDGLTLHEFKTTSSPKTYSDYFDSLQWRCYMMALPDAVKAVYHIIQMAKAEPEKVMDRAKITVYEFRREADNDATVLTWLNELTAWVLDDAEMLAKLQLDFQAMESRMADIVQDVYDGEENPVKARKELYKIAGNYDELQDALVSCLKEIKGA